MSNLFLNNKINLTLFRKRAIQKFNNIRSKFFLGGCLEGGWTKKYKFQKQFSNLPIKQFVLWNRLMILLHFCRKYYFTHLWTRSLQRLLLHLHLRDICSVRTGAEKIGKFDRYSHILMGQKMLAVCSTCSRFWANFPPSNPMKFS